MKNNTRAIASALTGAQKILSSSRFPTAVLDAEILLSFILKKDRSFLYAHPEYALSAPARKRFLRLLRKRSSGIPVAYITGHKEFFRLNFFVNKHVLIPRPDTETLVERVLDFVKTQKNQRLRILDVGTGSGCIAITLKKHVPGLSVTAVDISTQALAMARKNSTLHHTDVSFVRSNFFTSQKLSLYDIIVSNPPYLTLREAQKKNLAFEPKLALRIPKTPEVFFLEFIRDSFVHLKKGGKIFLEIGDEQSFLLREVFEKLSVTNFCFHRDLGGVERVVEITKEG